MSEELNFCRSCPATSPDKCWNPQSCTHAAMDRLIAEDADLIDPVQDRLVLAVRELAADDSQWVAEAFAETLRKALAMHGLVAEKADRIEALHEKLAAAYIALSGTDVHASDCATSNAPAYEPGPCDCKEAEQ